MVKKRQVTQIKPEENPKRNMMYEDSEKYIIDSFGYLGIDILKEREKIK